MVATLDQRACRTQSIRAPLGVKTLPRELQKTSLARLLFSCNVPNREGRIHFVDTLKALAGRVDGLDIPRSLKPPL